MNRKLALLFIPAVAALLMGAISMGLAKGKKKKAVPAVISRVFDFHCDTVYQGLDKERDLKKNKGAVDLVKLRKGNYIAQTFALWTPKNKGWKYLEDLHDLFDQWMEKYESEIVHVHTTAEISAADSKGKIGAVLSVEGLRPLEGDLEKIHVLYSWGVRILGITWWKSNEFGGSSTDSDPAKRTGLTEKGRKLVEMANELGMVIDVSHASDDVLRDVAKLSKQPFIASHSSAKALVDHNRNLNDELLKIVASKGGVVGVNFAVGYISKDPPKSVNRSSVVDHIMHMVSVMGVDHVALGSDFDGAKTPIGLKHAGQMQLLASDLKKKGLDQKDIEKIMYRNAMRVFGSVTGSVETTCGLAAFFQPWL